MQRLRNQRRGKSIRYLACGEYGAKGRPHYHGLLFGVSFHGDRFPLHRGDDVAFGSEELEEIWGQGRIEIGPANYATAAYVAGYVVKKGYDEALIHRPAEDAPFTYVRDPDSNSGFRKVAPEFNTMSRNPGLARDWIEDHLDLVYRDDQVRIEGRSFRPPAFYDRVLAEFRPDTWQEVQQRRREVVSTRGLSSGQQLAAKRSLHESSLLQRQQKIR